MVSVRFQCQPAASIINSNEKDKMKEIKRRDTRINRDLNPTRLVITIPTDMEWAFIISYT